MASVFVIVRRNTLSGRRPYLLSLGAVGLAAFFSSIAFLIDVSFVAVVRNKLRHDSGGDLTLAFGNSVWMTGGAALALWFATAATCMEVFACGWRNKFLLHSK